MFSLVVDPTNQNLVYISTSAANLNSVVYRVDATNGSWTSLASQSGFPNSQPHPDSRSLTFFPNSSTLVETDDGGIYELPNAASADIGFVPTQWISLVGNLRDTEFFSVGYDSVNNLVVGGAQDNGTPLGSGLAKPWDQLPSGTGDGGVVAVDSRIGSPTPVIYFYQDGQLYVSVFTHTILGDFYVSHFASLFGSNNLQLFSGVNSTDLATYLKGFNTDTSYPIALDPYAAVPGSEPLLLGISGLYESSTQGGFITEVTPSGSTGNVKAIAYGASNDLSAAYFSTTSGQLFVRNSPGATFVPVSVASGPLGATINKIVIDPNDYHSAYILDSQNNVWQLTLDANLNPTWSVITGNLGAIAGGKAENLQSLELFVSKSGTRVVLVGGLGGVYRRLPSPSSPPSPSGYSWTRYGTGLSNAVVTDLHYISPLTNNPPFNDILVAGTFGRGAWVVDFASQSLAVPSTLFVEGNVGDTMRLVLDSPNSPLLDVFDDNIHALIFRVPLALINAIEVADGGNCKLIVDESNGLINIPNPTGVLGYPNCDFDYFASAGDALEVNDQNDPYDPAPATIGLGNDQITGLGNLTMCYSKVSTVHFEGAASTNTFNLANADPAVTQTELDTGAIGSFVNVQQTAGAVTIQSGGPDSVTVGANGGNLDAIQGTVTVNGNVLAPVNILEVDDHADSNVASWSVAATATAPLGGNGGGVSRTYMANNVLHRTTVLYSTVGILTVDGGSGGSTFQLGGDLGLDLLPPKVIVNGAATGPAPTGGGSGPPPINNLILIDQVGPHFTTWNISQSDLLRSYSNPLPLHNTDIPFSNITSLTINAGTHGNKFQFSPFDQNLDLLPASVTVSGGSSSDTAILNDQALPKTGHAGWQVAAGTVTRTHPGSKGPITATVNYATIGTLTVNGGGGGNTFNIPSTAAGVVTIIHGGTGSNTFNVGSDGSSPGIIKRIVSALTLDGGSGTNNLIMDDSGNTSTVDVTSLTATSAGGSGFLGIGGSLTYSAFQTVTLNCSNAFHGPLPALFGADIMVTPQSGISFQINGGDRFPFTPHPGNRLTVSTVNGAVTDIPNPTPPYSGNFYFSNNLSKPIVSYTNIQTPQPVGWMVTAPDAGHSPEVKVFTAQTGALRFDITAFDPSFRGGVRVAVGDVNGDGIPDIIAAQGASDVANGDSLVHVYDGITGQHLASPLGSFDPFPGFHGGLYVASADLNGDGYADVVVSQDIGGQGWVKVYSGQDGSLLDQFQPFGTSFTGGVRLAAGPVTGNGHVDVVTGAGPGGRPLVEVFDGPGLVQGVSTPVVTFEAFDTSFTGGVYVATGLIHDQGHPPAEIIVGEGAGGEPRVSVFDGAGTPLQRFLAFEPGFKGGVRVAAADVNGDGRSDIVTAEGPGSLPRVRAFDGVSLQQIDSFFAFSANVRNGLFVAGGGRWGLFNPAPTEPDPQHNLPSISQGSTLLVLRSGLFVSPGGLIEPRDQRSEVRDPRTQPSGAVSGFLTGIRDPEPVDTASGLNTLNITQDNRLARLSSNVSSDRFWTDFTDDVVSELVAENMANILVR